MKLYIDKLLATIRRYIWDTRPEHLPRYLRPFLSILRIGHLLLRDLVEGQLTLRSMGLVYTTLLEIGRAHV